MFKVVVFAGHDDDTWDLHGSKGIYTDLTKDGDYEEYDTNIIIARGIVERLERHNDVEVLFPQRNGQDMTLAERVAVCNNENVDIAVFTHSNAAGRNATGAAAFYYHTSPEGKKLAALYKDEMQKRNFPLWSNGMYPCTPGTWSNFYVVRNTAMPVVLTENFFFTNPHELKKYLLNPDNREKIADAQYNMVCRYFGIKGGSSNHDYEPPKRQEKPAKDNKSDDNDSKWNKVSGNWHGQLLQRWDYGGAVRELQKLTSNNNPPFYPNNSAKNNGIDGYYGAHTEDCVRRYQSYYGLTVDGLAGKKTYESLTGNKSSGGNRKSISEMAQEVIDGKHGNGHANRRNSLGVSQSVYNKVRDKVNDILSGGSSSGGGKSIDQMADEIIQNPNVPNGHEARRKWLGISKSRYAKVRKEVNSRF